MARKKLTTAQRRAIDLPIHLSRAPQTIHKDAWYYEEKGKLHVVVWATAEWAMSRGDRLAVHVDIPWRKIEASINRMRTELGKGRKS